jgi:hypothetical protein
MTTWKLQKDKQWSTKHATQKTKVWATRAPLKPVDDIRCSRKVSSLCTISGTRRVSLVTNLMITHEWGKDRIMITKRHHVLTTTLNSDDQAPRGARVAQTLVFCVACFVDHCLSFWNFHVVIVLSVLLRLTVSDYLFCIFKLFLEGEKLMISVDLFDEVVNHHSVTL